MSADARKMEAIIREVRACFNRLRAFGDALHQDVAVSAAMRAVMETLDESGEQTVPRIARAKSVTRQHIQVLVNALTDAKLAATRANPDDRRSPLVALTARGKASFARMRQREQAVLAEMAQALRGRDLDAAHAALAALRAWLDGRLPRG